MEMSSRSAALLMTVYEQKAEGDNMTDWYPEVSVIVPVWNTREPFLRKCVQSILTQSFAGFELLLIDDGSEPSCAQLLDELAQQDARIRVFHQPNGGPSRARNLGLGQAKGKYIAFVDSDDLAFPAFLEDAVQSIEHHQADIVWGQAELCDAAGRSLAAKTYRARELALDVTPELIEEVWLRHGLKKDFPELSGRIRPEVWAKLFRRSTIGLLRFEEQLQHGEDMVFLFQLLQRCQRAAFIPRSWYTHRIDSHFIQNGISPQRRQRYQNFLEAIDECCMQAAQAQRSELAAMRDAKIANSMMDLLTPYARTLPLADAVRQVHATLWNRAFANYSANLKFCRMYTPKEKAKWLCCKFRLSLLLTWILRRKSIQ